MDNDDWKMCTKNYQRRCNSFGAARCADGWHLTEECWTKIALAASMAAGPDAEARVSQVAEMLLGAPKRRRTGKITKIESPDETHEGERHKETMNTLAAASRSDTKANPRKSEIANTNSEHPKPRHYKSYPYGDNPAKCEPGAQPQQRGSTTHMSHVIDLD